MHDQHTDCSPLDSQPGQRSDGPRDWTLIASPFGSGDWWAAHTPNGELSIVPPGLVGHVFEDENERVGWRLVSGDPLDTRIRAEVQPLALTDVLYRLQDSQHKRVRELCTIQLRQFDLYSHNLRGRPEEDRAREVASLRAVLVADLKNAFPSESWSDETLLGRRPVPDTAAQLLARLDGRDDNRHIRVLERIRDLRVYLMSILRRLWQLVRTALPPRSTHVS